MTTVAAVAPSWLGFPPVLVTLPMQRTETPQLGFAADVDQATARKARAQNDPRGSSRTAERSTDLVAGSGFRRRLAAVDPDEAKGAERAGAQAEAPVERRGRARQPTNPFPTAASAPFFAQVLAQRPARPGEETDDAPASGNAQGIAAYRDAAAFAMDRRATILGPIGAPLHLAA